ncbi:MAG: hypothetical protein M1374_05975 [Firmicutes bacterium]|jgi:hypothetical protein|nr:hypothetical protein [Bacillota bacterium]
MHKIEVLHIQDCPNHEPLIAELNEILEKHSGQYVLEEVLIASDEQGKKLGFHGSPTVLVDGEDPFPHAQGEVGLSCRRYEKNVSGKVVVSGYPDSEDVLGVLENLS